MLLFASLAFAAWPEPPSSGWETVQATPKIACTTDAAGLPWCYAEQDVTATFDRVVGVIKDLERYPDTFDHVDKVAKLDADTAWIHVDYPSPLTDRDYIAAFALSATAVVPGSDPAGAKNAFHLRFHAVEHAAAPPATEEVIRLPRAAGGYDCWDLGNGQTRIRYTWETEILGDLPSWISDRARLQHGTEVVVGIGERAK